MRFLLDTHAFLWFILDDLYLISSAATLIGSFNLRLAFNRIFQSLWQQLSAFSQGMVTT